MIKYCVIHDYGTDSYLKEEFDSEKEAVQVLKYWEKSTYEEYGEESDNNYVWLKEYDLSNSDDLEEYNSLKKF